MSQKEVRIGLRMDLKGTGGKQAAQELNEIDKGAKNSARSMDAMEAEARDLERALRGLAPGSAEFEKTAGQLGMVRKELRQASDMAEGFATKAAGAAGSGRNFGAAIGQAGFQIQDFAVQVGGGTSALTAFAQQGSQLLGMLGPGGAIAGAVLAIGAIAAKIISARKEAAASEEQLEKVKTLLEDLGEAFKELEDQREGDGNIADNFDEESEAIDRQTKAVLRNIETLKRREEIASKIRQAQGELELMALAGRESRGEVSAEDAAKQRREIEQRLERDRLLHAELQADLDKQAHEARVEAAVKELAAANEAKLAAEKVQATQKEMQAAYEVLAKAAKAMQRLQEIGKAGGAESGYFGEPFIDVARRRDEMAKLAPDVEAAGIPAALGGNAQSLEIVTKKLEELKKQLEALPPGAEEAIEAFKLAQQKLADAKAAMEAAADQQAGDRAGREQEALERGMERSEADRERLGEEAGDAIRKVFEDWVQSLGTAAEQKRPSELIEQVRTMLADGLQGGESEKMLVLVQEVARNINGNTAKTVTGFTIMRDTILSQSSRLDAVIRDLQRMQQDVRELSRKVK